MDAVIKLAKFVAALIFLVSVGTCVYVCGKTAKPDKAAEAEAPVAEPSSSRAVPAPAAEPPAPMAALPDYPVKARTILGLPRATVTKLLGKPTQLDAPEQVLYGFADGKVAVVVGFDKKAAIWIDVAVDGYRGTSEQELQLREWLGIAGAEGVVVEAYGSSFTVWDAKAKARAETAATNDAAKKGVDGRRAIADVFEFALRGDGLDDAKVATRGKGDVTLRIRSSICSQAWLDAAVDAFGVSQFTELGFEEVECQRGGKVYSTEVNAQAVAIRGHELMTKRRALADELRTAMNKGSSDTKAVVKLQGFDEDVLYIWYDDCAPGWVDGMLAAGSGSIGRAVREARLTQIDCHDGTETWTTRLER